MDRARILAYKESRYAEYSKYLASKPATKHILLIEDNKSDVALIKRMLKDSFNGYDLKFYNVSKMSDALQVIDSSSFDLAILDLSLIDIEGTAAVSAFHSQAPNIPIVVHTGSNCPNLIQEAMMCGAKHCMIKGRESPFSFKFMIEQALENTAA
jgi:DNA-binding NtrC family response regulator